VLLRGKSNGLGQDRISRFSRGHVDFHISAHATRDKKFTQGYDAGLDGLHCSHYWCDFICNLPDHDGEEVTAVVIRLL
jgi:hypothetical protein